MRPSNAVMLRGLRPQPTTPGSSQINIPSGSAYEIYPSNLYRPKTVFFFFAKKLIQKNNCYTHTHTQNCLQLGKNHSSPFTNFLRLFQNLNRNFLS